MSTRNWLCKSLAGCAAVLAATVSTGLAADSGKPNIVIIYADDLGWMDVACAVVCPCTLATSPEVW